MRAFYSVWRHFVVFWQATFFSLIVASFWGEKGSRSVCFKNVANTSNKFSIKKEDSEKLKLHSRSGAKRRRLQFLGSKL